MLTVLVLSASLASIPSTPEGIHLAGVTGSMSARLIAQAPPPLPVRPMESAPVGARQAQLQSEIDAINTQLRGLKADWPTASVVMAVLGWSLSPIALAGLFLFAIGTLISTPVLALVGVVMIVIGLAGVGLGIAGIVTGIAGQNAAKAERDELIQRRGGLERELNGLKQGSPPGVDRSFESSPRLFTLAAF
ncbi:MAG: hypothetical protein Q8N26_10420 [Myxococcales bacterium]|nr:hypothetical protein [Myxococcales bacterium]